MTDWVEVPRPERDGRCSDNQCPCPGAGRRIPRGGGFLYVSPDFVEFRNDCPDPESLRRKLESLQDAMADAVVVVDPELYKPILVCAEGARRRNLVLPVAGRDALHWWRTGLVPLRVTPTRRKPWQFWKTDPVVEPPDQDTRAWQSRVSKQRHANTEALEWATLFVGRGMECLLLALAKTDPAERDDQRRFAFDSLLGPALERLGTLPTDSSLEVRGWEAAETLVELADRLAAASDGEARQSGRAIRDLVQERLGL